MASTYSGLGQETITIDWRNFAAGMTSTNVTQDGGFSCGFPDSLSLVNPIAVPGFIYAPGSSTDKSSNLTGNMLASCEDPTVGGGASRLLISTDAQQDGRFYSMDSTGALTEKGAEDTTGNYIYGSADMIGYKGEAYVTNSANIVRWQQPNTFNYSFFNFSDTFAPHPALVYEDNAYYGDGNLLLRQTSAGGAPATILTLPSNQIIVSLGTDPGSGKMLISVVDQYNISGTINTQARVLYYDGFSNKATKVVLVDDMITAFYPVGGDVYCFYGQKMGYWTGAGIQFLRALTIDLDNVELVYKHHITNIGQTLYFIEERRIVAYGEVVARQGKAFYYALQNEQGGSTEIYRFVVNIGQNRLAMAWDDAKFFTFDTKSVSGVMTGGSRIFSLRYSFPRAVTFNQVVVQFGAALSSAGINQVGAILYPETVNYGDSSTNRVVMPSANTTQTGVNEWAFKWPTVETKTIQISISIGTTNIPIEGMVIHYNKKD